MKKAMIIDAVPMMRNGEVVYVTRPKLRGLGDAAATAAAVSNLNSVAALASSAAALVPNKPITVQSDFSKVTNVVATGAGTVAAAAAVFVPVGTVVAAVAGVVAIAAVLLGKIFANSKAKAMQAQAGQYEATTAQILYDNAQLDTQYSQTYAAIQNMRQTLSSLGGLGGLETYRESQMLDGLCLFNCKDAKADLKTAKEQYEVAQAEQDSKTKLMASLLDEYNKLLKAGFELKANTDTKNWILYIIGGVALAGGVYAAVSYGNKK